MHGKNSGEEWSTTRDEVEESEKRSSFSEEERVKEIENVSIKEVRNEKIGEENDKTSMKVESKKEKESGITGIKGKEEEKKVINDEGAKVQGKRERPPKDRTTLPVIAKLTKHRGMGFEYPQFSPRFERSEIPGTEVSQSVKQRSDSMENDADDEWEVVKEKGFQGGKKGLIDETKGVENGTKITRKAIMEIERAEDDWKDERVLSKEHRGLIDAFDKHNRLQKNLKLKNNEERCKDKLMFNISIKEDTRVEEFNLR